MTKQKAWQLSATLLSGGVFKMFPFSPSSLFSKRATRCSSSSGHANALLVIRFVSSEQKGFSLGTAELEWIPLGFLGINKSK